MNFQDDEKGNQYDILKWNISIHLRIYDVTEK